MKSRFGFISNSSSASFVIKISDLPKEQQEVFSNFASHLVKAGFAGTEEGAEDLLREWDFANIDDYYVGATTMDNADLGMLLEDELKIPGYYSDRYTPDSAFEEFKKNTNNNITEKGE